jgi:hypothetical protein
MRTDNGHQGRSAPLATVVQTCSISARSGGSSLQCFVSRPVLLQMWTQRRRSRPSCRLMSWTDCVRGCGQPGTDWLLRNGRKLASLDGSHRQSRHQRRHRSVQQPKRLPPTRHRLAAVTAPLLSPRRSQGQQLTLTLATQISRMTRVGRTSQSFGAMVRELLSQP